VPRYWELATEYESRKEALRSLALDPHGVLYREPERLLLDDLDDVARGSSILSLVGRGAHRVSEIAGRLGVPATSLSRPFALLVYLGLLEREAPWGRSARDSKRSRYRITDPFLRTWFRFVEPERSRLEAGQVEQVSQLTETRWSAHLGEAWEDLSRASVARLTLCGHRWRPASRWWGPGTDRRPLEIDLVAESVEDPTTVLCGEAKLSAGSRDVARCLAELRTKAEHCPALTNRSIHCAVWVLRRRGAIGQPDVVSAVDVVGSTLGQA
ncbi:MAG: ATP-binding protein, partial [Planctomycetota bacterium]